MVAGKPASKTPLGAVADEFAATYFGERRGVAWRKAEGDGIEFKLINGVARYRAAYEEHPQFGVRAVIYRMDDMTLPEG